MRIEEIKEEVFLVSECARPPWKEGESPPWNDAVCREISGKGIDSLMVLAESRTPFMVRTEGDLWCVIKPFADPDDPLPAELVGIADFVPYERAHGRTVGFWIGYESVNDRLVEQIYTGTPPEPQGDVALEEIKEHIGEKILLDGIPAVYFLGHHSREELQTSVERIVDLFYPNLILGISDELPEGGGEEAFDRMAWVAEYARTHGKPDEAAS